jgi:hypothetical protein
MTHQTSVARLKPSRSGLSTHPTHATHLTYSTHLTYPTHLTHPTYPAP